ncbi:MAG: hypothetical protein ACRCYU_02690 [Nocardioides sp.]
MIPGSAGEFWVSEGSVPVVLPEYPRWLWDDVLDALYEGATGCWERGRAELADAIVEVAEAVAKAVPS